MPKIYFPKTRYILVLLFVLLFQSTLPKFQNKIYYHASNGELIYDNCKDNEPSHPPLYVNLDSNNSFFIFNDEPLNDYYINSDKYFKKYLISPRLSTELLLPARAPPFFEV